MVSLSRYVAPTPNPNPTWPADVSSLPVALGPFSTDTITLTYGLLIPRPNRLRNPSRFRTRTIKGIGDCVKMGKQVILIKVWVGTQSMSGGSVLYLNYQIWFGTGSMPNIP